MKEIILLQAEVVNENLQNELELRDIYMECINIEYTSVITEDADTKKNGFIEILKKFWEAVKRIALWIKNKVILFFKKAILFSQRRLLDIKKIDTKIKLAFEKANFPRKRPQYICYFKLDTFEKIINEYSRIAMNINKSSGKIKMSNVATSDVQTQEACRNILNIIASTTVPSDANMSGDLYTPNGNYTINMDTLNNDPNSYKADHKTSDKKIEKNIAYKYINADNVSNLYKKVNDYIKFASKQITENDKLNNDFEKKIKELMNQENIDTQQIQDIKDIINMITQSTNFLMKTSAFMFKMAMFNVKAVIPNHLDGTEYHSDIDGNIVEKISKFLKGESEKTDKEKELEDKRENEFTKLKSYIRFSDPDIIKNLTPAEKQKFNKLSDEQKQTFLADRRKKLNKIY